MKQPNFQLALANARQSFLELSYSSNQFRNKILKSISQDLAKAKNKILKANQQDQLLAKKALQQKLLSLSLYKRLCLDEAKIRQLQTYPEGIIKLKDPIKQVQMSCELDKGLVLKRYSVPIGVLLVIFESRPEVLIQVSSLAIKSGNAVLLKGGSEAHHTNVVLFEIIQNSLAKYKLENLVYLVTKRLEVQNLIQKSGIDLIIPRGSNKMVREIQENTKTPVLGHAEGICHIYIDEKADHKKAIPIAIDGKTEYPAVCNATESLLLHNNLDNALVIKLLKNLVAKGVELRLDKGLASLAKKNAIKYIDAKEQDWKTEYNDLILSIKLVDSTEAAIRHINHYGSHHTDTIVTEDKKMLRDFYGW